jgi:protein tyrosine phosphatase
MNTNKKIIKKRILEFVIESQENIKYGEIFPNEFDTRISKTIKLREKYSDIIPFTEKEKKDALDYLNALNAEDYETCNDFIII